MSTSIPPSLLRPPIRWTEKRRLLALLFFLVGFIAATICLVFQLITYCEHVEHAREKERNEEIEKAKRVQTALNTALSHLPEEATKLAVALRKADSETSRPVEAVSKSNEEARIEATSPIEERDASNANHRTGIPPTHESTESSESDLDTTEADHPLAALKAHYEAVIAKTVKEVIQARDAAPSEEATPVHLFQFGIGIAPRSGDLKSGDLKSADHPESDSSRLLVYALQRSPGLSCQEQATAGATCSPIPAFSPDVEYCICSDFATDAGDDYADDKNGARWYTQARDNAQKHPGQDGGQWVPPYFDTFTAANLTEFSMPFYTASGDFAGAVYANYSSREMRQLVGTEDLGGLGYAAVVWRTGEVVVHPVQDYVRRTQKLGDIPRYGKVWEQIEEALGRGQDPETSTDSTTSPMSTVVIRLLGEAEQKNAAVVAIFDADRGIDFGLVRRASIVSINAGAFALVCLISLLILRLPNARRAAAWAGSISISLTLFGAIAGIWHLVGLDSSLPGGQRRPLVSRGSLESELHELVGEDSAADDAAVTLQAASPEKRPAAIASNAACRVPTGLFIQSLEFEETNTVAVSGYVWQKYSDDLPPPPKAANEEVPHGSLPPEVAQALEARATPAATGSEIDPAPSSTHQGECDLETLSRGFLLPEATQFEKTLAYETRSGNSTVLGWAFKASLREDFTYTTYPLDTKDVWLRMWHEDFSKNVVLVPDFASYTDLRPSTLPGIDSRLVHTGWTVNHAFFNFSPVSYNTNFGRPGYVGQADFPELHYHVVLRRTFFSAFVKNLVPMLVAAIILFSVLLLVTREPKLSNRYGANTSGTMAGCSGLFFTVLLAHIQLRSDFQVDGVLYLEWFNFAMYGMILLVAVNAYFVSWNRPLRWVAFKDNLIAKVFYWPALLAVLLVATTLSFYKVDTTSDDVETPAPASHDSASSTYSGNHLR